MLALFYPGYVSSDAAEQWLQARTGRYTSAHPVLMAMTWSLTERVLPGPGGLFALHTALFWGALGWLARELFRRPLAQIATVAIIGLWPPVVGTLAHLWKDVPMVAFGLLALALLMYELRHPSRKLLALAVLSLTLACAYRHNALPLAVPLLWHIVARWLPGGHVWMRAMLTATLTLAVSVLATLPNRLPQVEQRAVWPVIALWDIAAISIERHVLLIPPSWHLPDLELPDLEQSFQPWSCTTIFSTNKLWISTYNRLSDRQLDELRNAWWRAASGNPAIYARHRLRVAGLLFGLDRRTLPPPGHLALSPGWVQIRENPPINAPPSPVRNHATNALMALTVTPLFAGWLYVAALAAAALVTRRRRVHPLFWPTLLSALAYMAPLPLIAPSAEFRYLLWPVIAALLVLALRLADGDERAASAPDR